MTATAVAPLARCVQVSCPARGCGTPARWVIGPDGRACDAHLPAMIRRTCQALNPTLSCRCNPSYSQSCPVCDGSIDQFLEPLPGEACIGFSAEGWLCDRRAEAGSDFCVEHQPLAADRLVVIA